MSYHSDKLKKGFCVHGHCDLDLWLNDLKINRVHLLVRPNPQIKFEDHRSRHCWIITRTSFGLQTDRTDRHVQSNIPLFFEGGIIMFTTSWIKTLHCVRLLCIICILFSLLWNVCNWSLDNQDKLSILKKQRAAQNIYKFLLPESWALPTIYGGIQHSWIPRIKNLTIIYHHFKLTYLVRTV